MEATITLIDEFGKDVTVFAGIDNITSIPDVVANACISQHDNSSILFRGTEYVLVDSRETVECLVKCCVSGLLADTSRTLISEVVAGQYGGYVVMVIEISE